MTREDLKKEVLSLKGNNWLFELPTGTGKSKIAIDKIKSLYKKDDKTLLIVVPRNVLKANWNEELKKWWSKCNLRVEYTTYVSFPKHKGYWDYILFDECFRGDVEILTDKGFKRFDALEGNEKIAQYNDDSTIEFVNPVRFIKNPYKGQLCNLTLGRGRSCYMTPNHNQVYKTKSVDKLKLKPIKDLSLQGSTLIPVSGYGNGDNSPLTELERLFIAVQADGTLQRHQIKESVYSIQVTKNRKKERLLKLLSNYGNFTTIKGRKEVDRYMVKLPKGDAKLLSTHFDINMGKERALDFINEVVQWDGHICKGNLLYYSSKIKENADFVNAVAVQAGFKVLQSIEKDSRKDSFSDIYRVFMRKDTTEVSSAPMKKEYIPYDGYVYCVEVPSHKIVVRSEGYTFISGNCHHLSERCREALCDFEFKHSILLSATVGRELRDEFREIFSNLVSYKKDLRDIIEEEILPDPKVYLLPLELRNDLPTESIWKNPKAKGQLIETPWATRWQYIKQKTNPVRIYCTQKQYMLDLDSQIDYWKRTYMRTKNVIAKNKWLKLCSERLKWLSDKKVGYIYELLVHLKNYRTLTFCNSVEQTELLGEYCINSKNKESINNLRKFNAGKIDHITACNMVNEGCNLTNCQVGIYANLNSSEIIIKQRMGRILRHPNPVIIVPYYKDTREAELVQKMLEDYNPDLVTVISNITNINL